MAVITSVVLRCCSGATRATSLGATSRSCDGYNWWRDWNRLAGSGRRSCLATGHPDGRGRRGTCLGGINLEHVHATWVVGSEKASPEFISAISTTLHKPSRQHLQQHFRHNYLSPASECSISFKKDRREWGSFPLAWLDTFPNFQRHECSRFYNGA